MASNGSYTATLSPTTDALGSVLPPARHQALSSSISSLNSSTSSRHGSSHISKTYRQASSLFLTRRLPEALSTILPLITSSAADASNGAAEPSPVARASRNTRIKVWSLYLTVLNAIVELSSDEGKDAFGSHEWRALTAKVRDGEIWEEVVQNGYHGIEGDVDSEVVINLATLLLAHSPTQTINQKRLENYLASCTTPTFDITKRMQGAQSPRIAPRYRSPAKGASGADTPRDLNARVKILELYTLHVLVRNNEWGYAQEFISASSVLDEERREAFLQALQSLKEDQEAEETRQAEAELAEREKQEELERQARLQEEKERRERAMAEQQANDNSSGAKHHDLERRPSASGSASSAKKSKRQGSKASPGSAGGTPRAPKSNLPKGKSSKPARPKPSLASKAAIILSNIGALVENVGASLRTNPMLVLRTLGFLIGLLLVFGRKDIRQRLARIFGRSWQKVLATAGMGTKISYI